MTAHAIPAPPTHPEFADAIDHWTPVISPSGIAFYTSDAIPGWKGNLLIGGLSSEAIVRLTLDGETVTGRSASRWAPAFATWRKGLTVRSTP